MFSELCWKALAWNKTYFLIRWRTCKRLLRDLSGLYLSVWGQLYQCALIRMTSSDKTGIWIMKVYSDLCTRTVWDDAQCVLWREGFDPAAAPVLDTRQLMATSHNKIHNSIGLNECVQLVQEQVWLLWMVSHFITTVFIVYVVHNGC